MNYRTTPFITFYSICHLMADAACAFLMLGTVNLSEHIIIGLLLYNGFAFVLQAPVGYIIDRTLNPKWASILGLLFIAISFLFWNTTFAAIIIAGIGNSFFHAGAGSMVLSLQKKKAACAGIFVATGGIGLALGAYLADSPIDFFIQSVPTVSAVSAGLVLLGVLLYFVKTPAINRTTEGEQIPANYRFFLIILIMLPIIVRSLIGLSLDFPWKSAQPLLIAMVSAIALGKVVGGILADKIGLMKVGVCGLIASAPLLAFFPAIPVLGILGVFLLNLTMPVTLVAILKVIPDRKGLTFGITTVAIFIGAIPKIVGIDWWIQDVWLVFTLIFGASLILFTAIQKLKI